MITLYSWTTPNGEKPIILLEELGLDYTLKAVHIGKGEQHTPEFVAINPNGRIPAVTLEKDGKSRRIFESAAIMIALAEEHGKFLPASGPERAETLSWAMWQMGGLGPMMGQYGHFARAESHIPYAIKRYRDETLRLLSVLNDNLDGRSFVAGENYSIADMLIWPWAKGAFFWMKGNEDDLAKFTHLKRWVDAIAERPAVVRALEKLKAMAEGHNKGLSA